MLSAASTPITFQGKLKNPTPEQHATRLLRRVRRDLPGMFDRKPPLFPASDLNRERTQRQLFPYPDHLWLADASVVTGPLGTLTDQAGPWPTYADQIAMHRFTSLWRDDEGLSPEALQVEKITRRDRARLLREAEMMHRACIPVGTSGNDIRGVTVELPADTKLRYRLYGAKSEMLPREIPPYGTLYSAMMKGMALAEEGQGNSERAAFWRKEAQDLTRSTVSAQRHARAEKWDHLFSRRDDNPFRID